MRDEGVSVMLVLDFTGFTKRFQVRINKSRLSALRRADMETEVQVVCEDQSSPGQFTIGPFQVHYRFITYKKNSGKITVLVGFFLGEEAIMELHSKYGTAIIASK